MLPAEGAATLLLDPGGFVLLPVKPSALYLDKKQISQMSETFAGRPPDKTASDQCD